MVLSRPPMAGWLVLLVLTAFAAFAALALVVRLDIEGRAEKLIAWTAVFLGLLAAPVMLLGYLNHLVPSVLAPTSIAMSSGLFYVASLKRDLGEHARASGKMALSLLRMPWEGFRLALAARSITTLGLFAAAVVILWSIVLTYYAPSENWDGFFYHEPMVGFAIQNHGFRMVDLPPVDVVQQTNGFPRLCESIAIWFCIFTDKSLIEIGNSIAAPGLVVAMYALARARSRDVVSCMGWGAALLLVPAMYSQLRTSLVDVMVGFFLVAAVHFALRPKIGRREVALGTLCLVLLVGSKGTALVWAPPIGLLMYVRLVMQEKGRRGAAVGLGALGVLAMIGMASLTLVRNYLAFKNPLWPVSYEIKSLHVVWPGLISMETMGAETTLAGLADQKLAHPIGGVSDIIRHDYGYAVPWVIAPLAAFGGVVCLVRAFAARMRRAPDANAESALLVFALGWLFLRLPPGPVVARYNIHVVALGMAVIAAAAESKREGSRFHDGAVACALILSIVPWYWTDFWGGLDMTPDGIKKLMKAPAAERSTMNFATFQMPEAIAQKRDAELGRGDLVTFTKDEPFVGVLWNHKIDNRVEYTPFESAPQFLATMDARCPKWALVGGEGRGALETRPEQWELIGTAVGQTGTVVFRRKGECHR